MARDYIIPNIGRIKLKDLLPDHVQDLYDKLLKKQVGISAIRITHTVLHGTFSQAVKMGLIGRNPASAAQPPKESSEEMSILNETQINQLLLGARKHRWHALFHLAVTTGMR